MQELSNTELVAKLRQSVIDTAEAIKAAKGVASTVDDQPLLEDASDIARVSAS